MSEPRIFEQFEQAVESLSEDAENGAEWRRNLAQPKFNPLNGSRKNRRDLLKNLDRVEINDWATQAWSEAPDTSAGAYVAAELQHDFLAGLARDLYHLRSGRVARMLRQASMDKSTPAVLRRGVMGHVQRIVERSTANG